MPKSYPDVTRSGAASAEVQEEGRKPTTPASPGLALNSHLILTLILVELRFDICFSCSCFGSEEWASIYRGRRLGRVEDLPPDVSVVSSFCLFHISFIRTPM